jgi:hypothetical protein
MKSINRNNSVHDMERLIKLSVEDIIKQTKESRKKRKNRRKKKVTSDYFNKFNVPVKSNLIPVKNLDKKFSRFVDGNKDPLKHTLVKTYTDRVPNADVIDSSLSDVGISDGGGDVTPPIDGYGWGGSPFGTLGFGESLNNQKSKFIEYINNIYDSNTVDDVDILLSTVVKGYKTLFDTLEQKTTVFLMGMQPSFSKYFKDSIDDFVFAINNFMGDLVCIYIGESNGFESLDDIKDWYLHIGIDENIIENIVFVEKSTPINPSSMIDCEFTGKSGELDDITDIFNLVKDINNAILVGCFDLYFAFDIMLCLSKINKRFEIDKRFSFMVE